MRKPNGSGGFMSGVLGSSIGSAFTKDRESEEF